MNEFRKQIDILEVRLKDMEKNYYRRFSEIKEYDDLKITIQLAKRWISNEKEKGSPGI
jgi:hypothetical protein